jgi:nucleotide-binding universal stress UspA family protein
MITGEPLLAPWFASTPLARGVAYLAVPLVLWAAFVHNHRRFESRIHARLAEFARQRPRAASSTDDAPHPTTTAANGGMAMLKVLVPVDGSANSLRAVRHAIAEYQRDHELELHLLNVQPHLSRHVARFVSRHDRDAWHHDQAVGALESAVGVLREHGVPHRVHWAVGDRAAEICRSARDLGAHHIVMGTARRNSITRMLEDSVTDRVLQATPVPVEVIAGDAVSKWEQWGIPAGVLGAGGLLLFAAVD